MYQVKFYVLLDVEHILNSEVKCTICNDDLLHEIISKKMIMVHQNHLFLCCYVSFIYPIYEKYTRMVETQVMYPLKLILLASLT